jgi:hypothetical protein
MIANKLVLIATQNDRKDSFESFVLILEKSIEDS